MTDVPLAIRVCLHDEKKKRKKKSKVLETSGLKWLYDVDFNRPQVLATISHKPEGCCSALLAQVKVDR